MTRRFAQTLASLARVVEIRIGIQLLKVETQSEARLSGRSLTSCHRHGCVAIKIVQNMSPPDLAAAICVAKKQNTTPRPGRRCSMHAVAIMELNRIYRLGLLTQSQCECTSRKAAVVIKPTVPPLFRPFAESCPAEL